MLSIAIKSTTGSAMRNAANQRRARSVEAVNSKTNHTVRKGMIITKAKRTFIVNK